MALGGMAGGTISVNAMTNKLDTIFSDYVCDKDGMPKIKIHGFGITSLPLLLRYPWYSVDSTSWVLTGRFGAIFVPKKTNGKYDYGKIPYKVNVSDRSPSVKDAGQHYLTFSRMEQREIKKYLDEKGYVMGESDDAGEIITKGVSNWYPHRDELNIAYFMDLEKYLPKWPWAFKLNRVEGFGFC